MKSTKWTIFIRLIFCILGFIFGVIEIIVFDKSYLFFGILINIMCAILIAIHVPLLIKYHRLAKVCTAYEGTFVEFVSPAIGFACMRVKFTVNDEEKTMDSLRVLFYNWHITSVNRPKMGVSCPTPTLSHY
ncbi:MAG: hypothetical protein IKD03_01915, partial [Clostridia bacterium]|nr:hypothetical protein [Clostridia bacterium]